MRREQNQGSSRSTTSSAATGWQTPYFKYLTLKKLPEDNKEATRIQRKSAKFVLVGEQLYHRGYSSPLQKCVIEDEASEVLKEIHEGIYRSHIRSATQTRLFLAQHERRCKKISEQMQELSRARVHSETLVRVHYIRRLSHPIRSMRN